MKKTTILNYLIGVKENLNLIPNKTETQIKDIGGFFLLVLQIKPI